MPESTGTVTSVKLPSSTIAFTGFAVGGGPSVPTIAWSTYVPGARAISNRPTASVRSLPTTEPSRRARTSTRGVGSSGEGDASCTAGHCGPNRTTPRPPESASAPEPSSPHAARSRGTSSSTGRNRFTRVRRPDPGCRSGSASVAVGLGAQRADVREVPVLLGEVQPVADDEVRRDLEAAVAHVDLDPLDAGLPEQGADLQTRRATAAQVLEEVVQREARVHDVLDEQHVAPLEVVVQVLQDPDDARGLRRGSVRRDGHEVHLDRQPHVAREIGHHHEGALQHADEQEVAALVVLGDLVSEVPEHPLDLLLGDHHALDVTLEHGHRGVDRYFAWLGQRDPAFHLAPLHTRLSGEVRERETYSRSRSAFKPCDRSRRRPGRPAARSSTASTSSRVASALQRRSPSRTTREATARGSVASRAARRSAPKADSSTTSSNASSARRASSSASSRRSAAVCASGSRPRRRSA